MLTAIGSSAFSSPAKNSDSTGGLEAQIDRYQQELSNCVNCSTAKTLEGKEKIQAISNKISALRARIQEIEAEKSNVQPSAPADTTAIKNKPASEIQYGSASASFPATGSRTETVGNRLDVFA